MLPHNYLEFQLSNRIKTNIKILTSIESFSELSYKLIKPNKQTIIKDEFHDTGHIFIPNKQLYLQEFSRQLLSK